MTWPCHLSRRVQSTLAGWSSCILSKRSCKLTWSFKLVVAPHIQRIIARSLHCRWCKSDKVEAQVSLAWSTALLAHKLQILYLGVIGNELGWGWAGARCEFTPCDTASWNGSEFTTATRGHCQINRQDKLLLHGICTSTMGHVVLAFITGIAMLMPQSTVKLLQLIGRSGTLMIGSLMIGSPTFKWVAVIWFKDRAPVL